jgi:hypothetical protein
MGCCNTNKNNTIKKSRKIYIDLLTDNEPIIQPELFCGNSIKTTNYNM